jgi:hypothetical protein
MNGLATRLTTLWRPVRASRSATDSRWIRTLAGANLFWLLFVVTGLLELTIAVAWLLPVWLGLLVAVLGLAAALGLVLACRWARTVSDPRTRES